VLVDAPCSATGTMARHPDARWRVTPRTIERAAERQRALLAAAAALVRPGGLLVYATCSLEPEENSDIVTKFLARHPRFVAHPPRAQSPPPWSHPPATFSRCRSATEWTARTRPGSPGCPDAVTPAYSAGSGMETPTLDALGARRWALALLGALLGGYLTAYLLLFPAPLLHGHGVVPRVLGCRCRRPLTSSAKPVSRCRKAAASRTPRRPRARSSGRTRRRA